MDKPIDKAEYGRKLMEEINREEALKAGIDSLFLWTKIREGIDEEEGSVRFNYTKLASEFLGMKLADRLEHSGSVGIIPQLSESDRAILVASVKQGMPDLIAEAHKENEEE